MAFWRRVGLLAVGLIMACARPEEGASDEAAVINGQADTTHHAVVALFMAHGGTLGTCSGTIVKTVPERNIGYVLTAAHCLDEPNTRVAVYDVDNASHLAGAHQYRVVDFKAHPDFSGTGSPYDVGIVTISGVDANTPIIPVMSPDGLRRGVGIVSYGYGRTVAPGTDDNAPKLRRAIKGTVLNAIDNKVETYYGENAGICNGDSGGPVVATLMASGKEVVVGVHSYGPNTCLITPTDASAPVGIGYSTRPSTVLAFLESITGPLAFTPTAVTDAGVDASPVDAAPPPVVDSGPPPVVHVDASVPVDAGVDAGRDAGVDAGQAAPTDDDDPPIYAPNKLPAPKKPSFGDAGDEGSGAAPSQDGDEGGCSVRGARDARGEGIALTLLAAVGLACSRRRRRS
jgi:MYXO-CTERM domain-containing protein